MRKRERIPRRFAFKRWISVLKTKKMKKIKIKKEKKLKKIK